MHKHIFILIFLLGLMGSWGCRPGPSPLPPPEEISASPAPTPLTIPVLPTLLSPLPDISPPPTPPLAMKIIFHSDRDGDHEIYSFNFAGGRLRQLTDNQVFDGYPSRSPDGKNIVFVSERDGNREIYLMDADGGDCRRLTRTDEPDDYPAWSPTNDKIAYFSGQEAADNLHLLDLVTREEVILTDFKEGRGGPLVFSPDGGQIAFVFCRLQQFKIYLVDLATHRVKEIIKHAVPESRICWTPDGKRLLYVSGKGSEENIWMLVLADGRFKRITHNAAIDNSPCLSPDGEKLIFSSQRDGENWQLYLVNLWKKDNGEKPRRLTTDSYNYYYPDWM